MELSVTKAAKDCGLTARDIQHAIATGSLPFHRVLGRTYSVDAVIFQAWCRARAMGKRWKPRIRAAAIALLDGMPLEADIRSDEKSRLRSKLHMMDAGSLVFRMNAVSGWYRYRSTNNSTQVAWIGLGNTVLAQRLGLIGEGEFKIGIVDSLDEAELDQGFVLDSDGEVLLSENTYLGSGELADLVVLYLFGDSRTFQAAQQELAIRLKSC